MRHAANLNRETDEGSSSRHTGLRLALRSHDTCSIATAGLRAAAALAGTRTAARGAALIRGCTATGVVSRLAGRILVRTSSCVAPTRLGRRDQHGLCAAAQGQPGLREPGEPVGRLRIAGGHSLQEARWLIRSLGSATNAAQGGRTIVQRQAGSREGRTRRCNRDPARRGRAVAMHESTISRVSTASTCTRAGIFEFRFSLEPRLGRDAGTFPRSPSGRASASSRRRRAGEAVSDAQLADVLSREGVKVRGEQWPVPRGARPRSSSERRQATARPRLTGTRTEIASRTRRAAGKHGKIRREDELRVN